MPVMSQEEYIAILLSDCGYGTSAQRRGWLKLRFGKAYTDELTAKQKSIAIEVLKIEKSLGI